MLRTDWNSTDVCFVDFETQSLADLRKVGGRAYARHPSTRPTLLACRRSNKRAIWINPVYPCNVEVISGYQVVRVLPDWVLSAPVLCGHNSYEFDAHVWNASAELLNVHTDMAWRDTALICRAAALPGGLDKAAEQLLGARKDSRGYALKNMLCKAKVGRDGSVTYPIGTPEVWLAFAEYCCQDCDLMAELHRHIIKYVEPSALTCHQEINDTGVPIDVILAGKLVLLQDELDLRAGKRVAELTEDDLEMGDVKSTLKVRKWLASRGINVSSLDKRALRDLLEDPDEFGDQVAAEVLRLRCQVVRATAGKAVKMIEAAGWERGRARGLFVYYGAHTGRFSARQVQPHNFIRPLDEIDVHKLASLRKDLTLADVDAEAERASIERAAKGLAPCTSSDVLASLLRPCIACNDGLGIADYGAVEARMVSWLVDEVNDLAAFRDTSRDLYIELAKQIYNTENITKSQRFVAKQSILGCGYGMSHIKFQATLESFGVKDSGVDPKVVVETYRNSHPFTVAGWAAIDRAAREAIKTGGADACKIRFRMMGPDLLMFLPSGRPIVYRSARIEMKVPGYCAIYGLPPEPKAQLVCRHPRGYDMDMYGGRWIENAAQGICRDLLVNAMAKLTRICFHAHDELVREGGSAENMAIVMSTPPDWAEGFPCLVESYDSPRYAKKPPKGGKVYRALEGKLV